LKKTITICFVLVSLFVQGQGLEQRALDSTQLILNLDSLKEVMGDYKDVPKEYELSFFTALSNFPELTNSKITFKKAKIKTTLNARPTVASLFFKSRLNRSYVIRVNSKLGDSLVLLYDVPFNARVGLFGHELSHFADYRTRSIGGVLKRLFSYSSIRKKEKFEKEIDSLTIQRGFGWQLYDWSSYVLHASPATIDYKGYKRKVYLEPEEIREILEAVEE
jgi:hypothetical protein